ncbi:hypothetical protein B0H14DRAFT_2348629 [Mycena olivaceomarginata]|nr:hypothetical protein B0H14DRAFT_2348629 [Mycena olivaceomarginata]
MSFHCRQVISFLASDGPTVFNGLDGPQYRWRPSSNTYIVLRDSNNDIVAFCHPTHQARYQFGDPYFIRMADSGTVVHPLKNSPASIIPLY